jgi:hypothetical protein
VEEGGSSTLGGVGAAHLLREQVLRGQVPDPRCPEKCQALRSHPVKCHPLEGPLSTPDTSPCPSPPGVAWLRTFVLGQYLLVAALRARLLVCWVRRFRTSHPSGSRLWSREPASAPLAHCAPRKSSVPDRVQGWRTAEVSYPEERGASTSWLATWAHLRQRATRRGAGAQSGVMG